MNDETADGRIRSLQSKLRGRLSVSGRPKLVLPLRGSYRKELGRAGEKRHSAGGRNMV